MNIEEFQQTIKNYYSGNKRDLPWRTPGASIHPNGHMDPYIITVSEVMLQQTQAQRVIPKFHEFMLKFPTVEVLASADTADVLTHWSGLGYNRRALYLQNLARAIAGSSRWPNTPEDFVALPGIGPNTAAAICVYTYNQPHVFIETNVRSVFIHHFFNDQTAVADTQLLPLVEQALQGQDPREWYWALMDYGTFLKQAGNPSRRSRHHTKQSRFEGSARQIRGRVLKLLITGPQTLTELSEEIDDLRIGHILEQLDLEGFITHTEGIYALAR